MRSGGMPRTPIGPRVSASQLSRTALMISPMASVATVKKMRTRRIAGIATTRATKPATRADGGEVLGEPGAELGGEQAGGVGADAVERGVAERHQPGGAGDEVEAAGQDREDHGEFGEAEQIALAGNGEQRGERAEQHQEDKAGRRV